MQADRLFSVQWNFALADWVKILVGGAHWHELDFLTTYSPKSSSEVNTRACAEGTFFGSRMDCYVISEQS